MIPASQMRPGLVVRHEGHLFRVISAEYHGGQGKMGGVAHARLKNLDTGAFWEHGFRSDLKMEVVEVERQNLEFLYATADQYCFMNPQTFEQVEIPAAVIGASGKFLKLQMQLPIEFVDGRPISAVFPDIVELEVARTAPPVHQQQDNAWKQAELENGVSIRVPQFIKAGDTVRIDVEGLKYVERVKGAAR